MYLMSAPQEGIDDAWYCKPGQTWSMAKEVIGPSGEPTAIVLLNEQIVKEPSKYLFMSIDEHCSQP